MYRDKDKAREASKERMRRYRDKKGVTKGVTSVEGVTTPVTIEGVTGCNMGVTYPDLLDKLTNPWWRDRLGKICAAFRASHHPEYVQDVWLGEANLSVACDWLSVTS